MSCFDEIYGNDYYDFIVRNNEFLPLLGGDECTLDGGFGFTILFAPANQYPPLSVANYTYTAIPKCYTALSLEALEESGIIAVQANPALALDGEGVLLGFLDSGIDTTHPAFMDEAGNSRVVAVWNQNYMEENVSGDAAAGVPEVPYGRVYTQENMSLYGNGDVTGHGTYVASVAAGSARGDYSGAAPKADIAMVQLKEAKQYLKDYYFTPEDAICYQENDLIMGAKFLNELARSRNQSLVLCVALGTSLGNHSGNSPLSLYLDQIAVLYRRCVVCGTGNMAASRRHYYGNVFAKEQQNTQEEVPNSLTNLPDYKEVEVIVGEDTCGFVMEQWAVGTARYQVALVSPTGQLQPPAGIQASGSQMYTFPLEGTEVSIDYSQPEAISGVQMIYYRFRRPAPGVWRLRVYSNNMVDGAFHMYLAEEQLQCGEVYFLSSNPDTTIEDPGNAKRVLTVGGYNQRQNSILLESGRGFTIDGQIKPDIVAPAFMVDGAVAGSGERPEVLQYEASTGTSAAVAICAGAAAVFLQQDNKQPLNLASTTQVKNAFIQGANRGTEELYPNRLWGYGALDLYEVFRQL